MSYQFVVFDLDGTLIDSAPDLRHAVNVVLSEHGAEPLPLVQIRSMIGDGAAQLVTRALAARSITLDDPMKALHRFFAIYEADPTANTLYYGGVRETLQELKAAGLTLAVCTNKPVGPANEILRRLGLAEFFVSVVGGDTHSFRKPDPRMLTGMLDEFRVTSQRTLMVGDSEVDAATALNASVPFALMTYGYRRGPASEIACAVALDRFTDLPAFIART